MDVGNIIILKTRSSGHLQQRYASCPWDVAGLAPLLTSPESQVADIQCCIDFGGSPMIIRSHVSLPINRRCHHRTMKWLGIYCYLSSLLLVRGSDDLVKDSSVLDLDPPSFPPVLPPTATIESVYRNPITQIVEEIPGDPPSILYEPPPTASLNAETVEAISSPKKKPFHSPWSRTISASSRAGGPETQSSVPPLEVPYDLFTLAGKEQPMCRAVLKSVLPKHENCVELIRDSVLKVVHLEDITLLVGLGWLTVPLGRFLYEWLPSVLPWYNNSKKYRKTFYYEIVDHIQQIARIAMAVYMVDIVKLAVVACGYSIPGMKAGTSDLPHAFGHILYTMWIANRIRYIKRIVLRRYVNEHPESFGRMNLVQRWIDAIVYSATVLAVLHILRVESGVALNNSFLAVGSVGTLAFGLASQGIATQVMNGLLLASSDRIYEGDDVMLGSNGFAGRIVKLGWLETEIRGRYGRIAVLFAFSFCRKTHECVPFLSTTATRSPSVFPMPTCSRSASRIYLGSASPKSSRFYAYATRTWIRFRL
jgi:Mechanosensitive ion channel